MSKMSKNLARLSDIARVQLTLEMAKMAEIQKREDAQRAKITQHDREDSRIRGVVTSDDVDLTMLAAMPEWTRLRAGQKADAQRSLAEIAAQRETQMRATRKAFGKKDALEKLTARSKSAPRVHEG